MSDPPLGLREARVSRAKKPMKVGILVNLVLAVVKCAAGLMGHSYALVADGVESGADVLTSTGVLLGLGYAVKPADDDHPQGHGKAEPLVAMFVSIVLFAAAAVIASESAHLIVTPHEGPAPFTLLVLLGVLVTKELLFRFAKGVGDDVGSTAVKAEAIHQRSDVFVSAAAFVGISLALVLGKGHENADDWAALAASAVMAFNAFTIMAGAVGELLDTAPPESLRTRIRELASEVRDVAGTHKCVVRKVGLDLLVELDVIVDGDMTVQHAHEVAHAVQDHIRAVMPEVARVLVHIEPA